MDVFYILSYFLLDCDFLIEVSFLSSVHISFECQKYIKCIYSQTFTVTQSLLGTLQTQVITLIKDDRRHKKTNYRVTISSDAVTQGSNGKHRVLLFIELVDEMSSLMM